MSIRQAILKAANSIEQNPDMFDFGSLYWPDCGTPGCALGWISVYSGIEREEFWTYSRDKLRELLGISNSGQFYGRMINISNHSNWSHSADKCAKALRLYADKYHPSESTHTGIPDSVLAIVNFEQLNEANCPLRGI